MKFYYPKALSSLDVTEIMGKLTISNVEAKTKANQLNMALSLYPTFLSDS